MLLSPSRGTVVQRCLYVDRYATKMTNIPNLRALERCLECRLDVISGDEESGDGRYDGQGHIWSYSDFFGRGGRRYQPHDRYLLVCTDDGTIVWHLSNSLLDGRSERGKACEDPEVPLRWRDLIAHLEDMQHLPEAMRRWVRGGLQ